MEAADEEFLFRLYASTREEELARVPWTEEEKRAFLAMQFRAQTLSYDQTHADADRWIIVSEGAPAGRLYVGELENEIRLIDIAVLPEYRNAGIGTALLSELIDKARRTGKPLRLHVEKMNRAMRLYQRLGFIKIEDGGVYDLLEWRVK